MTRHQRAAIAAAEEWLARQPPAAQSQLASRVRDAIKWVAAHTGGFVGSAGAAVGVETLKQGVLRIISRPIRKVRH
jgi:hypothetical protein